MPVLEVSSGLMQRLQAYLEGRIGRILRAQIERDDGSGALLELVLHDVYCEVTQAPAVEQGAGRDFFRGCIGKPCPGVVRGERNLQQRCEWIDKKWQAGFLCQFAETGLSLGHLSIDNHPGDACIPPGGEGRRRDDDVCHSEVVVVRGAHYQLRQVIHLRSGRMTRTGCTVHVIEGVIKGAV